MKIKIPANDLATVPIERSQTIPSAWYTEPDFHKLDQQAVLSATWQYVTHISRVKKPGDTFLTTIAGNPVIIVRDREEKLRAFYNVCKHRGGPLATECSSRKVLQCQYHGWTYLLDGTLRGVPEFDRVELFDKKDFGLTPIALEIWQEMVFVNLAPAPEPILRTFAGIAERIAPLSLAGKIFHKRTIYNVQTNWKVYVDNYLEGYHLPYVHPELCKLLDYHRYVTETFDRYSLQYSPFQEGENLYQAEGGEAFYYFVFPNFMLNILPGRLQTNLVVPVAPDRCQVIFDYYYDDIESEPARKVMADDEAYSDKVQAEDIEICEQVQKGLASCAYDRGRFSVKCEQGVYHFQQLLKQRYREFLGADS